MNYRTFCNIKVSEIGLGTWQLGADWGHVDDSTAHKILATAVENGVNFFDTADCYGEGLSETRLGKFIKTLSTEVVIATKIGRFPHPGGLENFSLDQFRKHTENSLRRLGVDALDLTQVHCPPTELIQQGDIFEWLKILKQEGKIKQFGLSVESMHEAQLCLQEEGVASLQIIFNVLRQKPIEAIFKEAQAKQVALIVRLPLASGLLTGKLRRDTAFADNDHRNFNRDGQAFNVGETFSGLPLDKGIELVESLKTYFPENISTSALRWILDFDAVSVVIPGSKNPQQVMDNCAASSLPPLSAGTHEALRKFYLKDVASHIRGKY
ncbi:MAG: aldo/keto reductase [Nitrospinaceae bacterium]|nr:aldo/keto reductase [Nitrospina sp.]MBT5867678.1 aldo/keto reductase [Nitrospinaceae bacterium]MBT6345680.1 aldo/keto reductase [Nitrospina sp.]